MKRFIHSVLVAAAVCVLALGAVAADKKIVLVAGRPSHGAGEHEFRSGCLLLQSWLNQVKGVHAEVYTNGWPSDPHAFDQAAAVLFFMDGGAGHPVAKEEHLKIVGDLAKKGVGIGFAHYAVEIPIDHGGSNFLAWTGGFYEDKVSTNPHWTADFKTFPKHPITRGVKPFAIKDEWYFNIHFRDGMKGITPILVAKPDDDTRLGKTASPHGPYPHIVAASGRSEVLMWAVENKGANRGFGFTGGHFNKNWGDENFRKVVLNAMLWIAKVNVPKKGVESTVTPEELSKNLDAKGRR